jgi:hypothetical protein
MGRNFLILTNSCSMRFLARIVLSLADSRTTLTWTRISTKCMTPYLKIKLDGKEFSDTNQLLQRAFPYENCAKYSRFQYNANKDKEKHQVHFLEEEANDEEGNELCVAKWVEKHGDKPILCSLLKPNGGRRDEIHFQCNEV